jgi:hypothetical protein
VPRRVVIGISPPMPTEDCRCQSVRKREDRFRAVWSPRHRGRFQRRRPEQRWRVAAVAPGGSAHWLSRAAAAALPEPRDPDRVEHGLREMLAQRIYGLCCGYEDLNDHKALRRFADANGGGRDQALASAPTLSRLENRATRAQAWALHGVLAGRSSSPATPRRPEELVLDIDASDVPLHGQQELGEFHAYYDHHCYLPLYVFCGQAMLACCLRPSKIDGAKHAAAVIKLSSRGCAKPGQRHASSCVPTRASVAERCCNGASARTWATCSGWRATPAARGGGVHGEAGAGRGLPASGVKQRAHRRVRLRGQELGRERRVITRLEYGAQGTNPRFIVTNLEGDPYSCMTACTASVAKPRTASRRRSSICSAREPAAIASCQPVAAAAGGAGLHADARLRRWRCRYGAGARQQRHHPLCGCSRSARPSCATRAACA